MDRSLTEAANNGDVEKLRSLVKGDPLILLRATSLSDGDNPLHISCIGGHVDFVKEILDMRPDFAQELNKDGFTPLHIASASGHIDIVRELVKSNDFLCMVKGKEKRIPLHCAVVKGRVKVINELLSVCSDSVKEVTARGESCLHLVVKNNQFEAFKVLCGHVVSSEKEYVLNMKDEHGDTILHLAASTKQYEVVHLLLDEKFGYKDRLEVNIPNKMGLTPLDVLASEGGDSDIEEMLRLSGAVRIQETPQNPIVEGPPVNNQLSGQGQTTSFRPHPRLRSAFSELQDYFKYDRTKGSDPEKARNTLLVVAALIMTIAYQGGISPPGGIWQDDFQPDNATSNGNLPRAHVAGKGVLGTISPRMYGIFVFLNTFCFHMSLQMMYYLTNGFPMQIELRLALYGLTLTYYLCLVAISPSSVITNFFLILVMVMPMMVVSLSLMRDCKKRRPRQSELRNTEDDRV